MFTVVSDSLVGRHKIPCAYKIPVFRQLAFTFDFSV